MVGDDATDTAAARDEGKLTNLKPRAEEIGATLSYSGSFCLVRGAAYRRPSRDQLKKHRIRETSAPYKFNISSNLN